MIPTPNEIRKAFIEVIEYINKHTKELKKNEPELFTEVCQFHLKELIKRWQEKDPSSQMLWDIKEHHHYINWLDKETPLGSLWFIYIKKGMSLRLHIMAINYENQKKTILAL